MIDPNTKKKMKFKMINKMMAAVPLSSSSSTSMSKCLLSSSSSSSNNETDSRILKRPKSINHNNSSSSSSSSYRCLSYNIISFSSIQRICLQYLHILIIFQMMTVMTKCSYEPTRSSATGKPIKAAINTHHTIGYQEVDLPPNQPYSPNLIEVKSSVPSFTIKFNSASSKMKVFHQHEPSGPREPEPKESFSQDEPHILRHQVIKPIVQEVHEIISPFRKIVQEIKPVIETIDTIVSRAVPGSNQQQNLGNTGSSGGNSGQTKIHSTSLTRTPMNPLSSLAPLPPAPVQASNENDNINHNRQQLSTGNNDYGNGNEMSPFAQKAFIGDLSRLVRKPDLMIMNENDLYDNSLYNGANEFDLKYPSMNKESNGNANLLIYEDRRR